MKRAVLLEEIGSLTRRLAAAERGEETEKARRAAAQSEAELLRRVVARSPELILVVAGDAVAAVSAGLSGRLGCLPADLEGAKLSAVFAPCSLSEVQECASRISPPRELRVELSAKSGGSECFDMSVETVPYGAAHALVLRGAMRTSAEAFEITEPKRQAQKMEAVGTLAGGVAHDMNNILGAIMGLASVLRAEMEPKDPRARDIDDILAATRRGRDLTRNLLGFARKGQYRREIVSMNRIIGEMQGLLGRTIPRNIHWRIDLEAGLPTVQGDYGQLSQAVMNVCINAADAMQHSGGTIMISSRKVVISPDEARRIGGLSAGEHVLVKIIDTGVGMDEATLARAFEPFFSTKEPDRGTGLGLSMVYGTMRNHAGAVVLESRLGMGTAVSLYLPSAGERAPDPRSSERLRPIKSIGAGSVLLVDDEPLVRRSATRVLEKLGYKVLGASNGEEALSLFAVHRAEVALVVLDLIMPVMDGEETFCRLRALDPELPILLTSGHTREGKAEELLQEGAIGFIPKPFDLQSFADAVLLASRDVMP